MAGSAGPSAIPPYGPHSPSGAQDPYSEPCVASNGSPKGHPPTRERVPLSLCGRHFGGVADRRGALCGWARRCHRRRVRPAWRRLIEGAAIAGWAAEEPALTARNGSVRTVDSTDWTTLVAAAVTPNEERALKGSQLPSPRSNTGGSTRGEMGLDWPATTRSALLLNDISASQFVVPALSILV
jgi:hypothetical protein